MPRITKLIPDRQREDRVLDHCDRVDREEPMHAAEDAEKRRKDATGRFLCPCGFRYASFGKRCWQCMSAEYKARTLARQRRNRAAFQAAVSARCKGVAV